MNRLYYYYIILCAYLLTVPEPVFAQGMTFREFVLTTIRPIVNSVLVIMYALCLLLFLWGLAKFILNAGDETERRKGKSFMLWGLIALLVLAVFYAVVYVVAGSFFGLTSPGYLPESGGFNIPNY